MNRSTDPPHDSRRLPVAWSDEITLAGTASVLLHVLCPHEGCPVRLERCSVCDECVGFDAGELTGAPPSVLCDA